MRGSVYYQSSILTKIIFKEGLKKEQRVDPLNEYYGCVSSYQTMETYKKVWENFFSYLREYWKIKNFELITQEHIDAYFQYKIEYYPTKQYAEKLSSSLGKLEVALNKYSMQKYKNPIKYNFDIRQIVLDNARNLELVSNNYINRTYQNPWFIISLLSNEQHKIAASIQLSGGARSEGITLIKYEQLKDIEIDQITGKKVGIIETKEKGGKVGDVLVSEDIYLQLYVFFLNNKQKNFKIKYSAYAKDIREACKIAGERQKGSHGFRWTFAQNRLREYQKNGYDYFQALQGVSWEMKHYRASITEHYLGK
jgi:integrase